MPDFKRIEREIRQCLADADTSVSVNTVDDDMCHLKGIFDGPDGTSYEGIWKHSVFFVYIHCC